MQGSNDNEFLICESKDDLIIKKEETVSLSPSEETDKVESSPPKKMTAFSMYEHFRKHTRYANIDGVFHIYNHSKKYYVPIDKHELENYLISIYYKEISQTNSLRIVKTCADLIIRQYVPEQASADKRMYLCFRNGYIPLADFNTAYFKPYTENDPPSSFIAPTYLLNATAVPQIGSWNIVKGLSTLQMDDFLYQISGGNEEIIHRIWQMIGYLLTPDMQGKCFFVLQGLPNTGKSVLGNLLSQLLPDHRIASLDIDQLGKRYATSALKDKSINISMDLPNKILSSLAIRNIKLMTGNDDITIEHKNGTLEKYRGYCKFLFATNHALTLAGYDRGFEERIVCIPFKHAIPPEKRNYNLLQELLRERDKIVSKAIAHYFDLRRRNYIFSGYDHESCQPQIRYLPTNAEDVDATLCSFVEAKCEFVPQDRGTYTEEIYHAYLAYCREHNETPIDKMSVFSHHLLKCYSEYIVRKRWRKTGSKENQWGFKGIAVEPIKPMTFSKDSFDVDENDTDWADISSDFDSSIHVIKTEDGQTIYNV